MGLYDNTLRKTLLGYQFDRPVYVGNQINANRLVTVKEIGNHVASIISSAEHVTYSLTKNISSSNGLTVTIGLSSSTSSTMQGSVTFSFTYDSTAEALVINAT